MPPIPNWPSAPCTRSTVWTKFRRFFLSAFDNCSATDVPAAGRRFAWQNKLRFAIRPEPAGCGLWHSPRHSGFRSVSAGMIRPEPRGKDKVVVFLKLNADAAIERAPGLREDISTCGARRVAP